MIDVTRQLKHFRDLIGLFTSISYVSAMKNYNLPCIRCFCGSYVFLYEPGTVPFNHLLKADFTAFKSDWRVNLQCLQADYLNICGQDISFQFCPSVIVKNEGFLLATCPNHDGGCKFRMIHVGRYPVCGNLSHPLENRLAAIAPTLPDATPLKVGEFSSTCTIAKSTGGSQGVGSLVLTRKRHLNVESDELIPAKESLFNHNRLGMKENVASIAIEEKSTVDIVLGDSSTFLRSFR